MLLALLGTLSVAAASSGRQEIPGGEPTTIKDNPYLAQVLRVDFGPLCSGSIISSSYVLTSANCHGPGFVRVASDRKYYGDRIHAIKNFSRHDTYDLMLIRVRKQFEFDETCQPIQLQQTDVPEDSVGWITGYGKGDLLHKSMIPMVDEKICGRVYKDQWGSELGPRTLCGGYHGRGGISPCEGDLGGPLVVDGRLAGIISRASSCDDPYALGFYTEVAEFHGWIQERTGALNSFFKKITLKGLL